MDNNTFQNILQNYRDNPNATNSSKLFTAIKEVITLTLYNRLKNKLYLNPIDLDIKIQDASTRLWERIVLNPEYKIKYIFAVATNEVKEQLYNHKIQKHDRTQGLDDIQHQSIEYEPVDHVEISGRELKLLTDYVSDCNCLEDYLVGVETYYNMEFVKTHLDILIQLFNDNTR